MHDGKRRPFVDAAQPANACRAGVDTPLAGFYRERYCSRPIRQSKRNCTPAFNENPARVIPVLGTIR
jgi:hypothetical protein